MAHLGVTRPARSLQANRHIVHHHNAPRWNFTVFTLVFSIKMSSLIWIRSETKGVHLVWLTLRLRLIGLVVGLLPLGVAIKFAHWLSVWGRNRVAILRRLSLFWSITSLERGSDNLLRFVVWNRAGRSIFVSYWNYVIDHDPGVISTRKNSVYILCSNICHMRESCFRLFIVQSSAIKHKQKSVNSSIFENKPLKNKMKEKQTYNYPWSPYPVA